VATGQLLALVDRPLAPWPHAAAVFWLTAGGGLAGGGLAGWWARSPEKDSSPDRLTPREEGLAAAAAVGAWALWAGVYYLAGALASPARTHQLAGSWESSLPFAASASLVYLGVHPLSVSPGFALESRSALRRHLRGQLAIVAVSAAFWLLFPVSYPRGPLDESGTVGAWVLGQIRGNDPDVNCFPSTHCAMAIHAALSLRAASPLGPWALLAALAIAISTLLTRQHYLLDALAGVTLGLAVWYGGRRAA
jgi:hypothetical protein